MAARVTGGSESLQPARAARFVRRPAGVRLAVLSSAALACIAVCAAAGGSARADTFQTSVPHAVLMDFDSGSVLFEKQADVAVPPASLAKLMTMEVVFNALAEGKVKAEDEFIISENAWRRGGAPSGGSAMFAILNSRVKLSDLMLGAIVQSGNDACIAIAEGMAGSEPAFAQVMNQRAREIGLTRSNFVNATGFHAGAQAMSARDAARLAAHLVRAYPAQYGMYGQREFTWNRIRQYNRNPLLDDGIGADGLKTGFVKEAGYNLVGSAVQSGQRLIVVVLGAKTEKERAEEARKLLDWGFRSFESRLLFEKDATIGEARTFGGEQGRVKLRADGAVRVLVPRGANERLLARIVYRGPIKAPVAAGAQVARLRVTRGDTSALDIPLFAAEPVERGGIVQRALDGVQELVIGLFRSGASRL